MAAEYLERTPTSTGNRSVYTWAGWVKRNKVDQDYYLFSSGNDTDNIFYISIRRDANNNNLTVLFRDGDSTSHTLVFNNNSFRDPGSWMHFVVSVNTTIVDPKSDRCKVYINGARLTGWTTDQLANLNQNSLTATNAATETCAIGDYSVSAGADVEDFQLFDYFLVDGQALTPDVFGFYKDGDGYQSSGTTNATDFRPGQWSPRAPKSIKHTINRSGGFGANGFYLPMNDSSNPGADFHCTPNSIITLKGEDLPQPQNGAPTTSDAYVSQLRTDPYAANLVLAVPGISTTTDSNRIVNGNFDSTNLSDWTTTDNTQSWNNGQLQINRSGGGGATSYQTFTTEVGKRYTVKGTVNSSGSRGDLRIYDGTGFGGTLLLNFSGTSGLTTTQTGSFTASSTTTSLGFSVDNNNTTIYVDNIIVKQEDAPIDYSADIKGSGTNKTLTAAGTAGIDIELGGYYGSAMTFDGTGDFLSIPNNSDFNYSDGGDFTIELWLYRKNTGGNDAIIGVFENSVARRGWQIEQRANEALRFQWWADGSSAGGTLDTSTSAVPVGQWTHVCAERNGDLVTLYINGVASAVDTSAGSFYNNTTDPLRIGVLNAAGDSDLNANIQDIRIYKGLAKYKGGFDVPKPYTPVGIEAFRTTTDTCKNNFATLNPLYNSASGDVALADGNLTYTGYQVPSYGMTQATQGVSSGKWYWEFRLGSTLGPNIGLGVMKLGTSRWPGLIPETAFVSGVDGGIGFYHGVANTIYYWDGDSQESVSYTIPACTTGDVISVALDLENGKIYYAKNGTWGNSGNPATGTNPVGLNLSGLYLPALSVGAAGSSNGAINFGQNPSFSGQTTAGTNADSNSKGLFKYAPPSGFLALCEDNLPAPAIADPGKHFKAVLYTGDNADSHAITGVGFQPDLVWIKQRTGTTSHNLTDSVRGIGKTLFSDADSGDNTNTNRLLSFDSSGFTVGANGAVNQSGSPFAAWCWKAGGPAVSNTDGSITSQVSVNQDAGFSIVSYTGTGNVISVGHGLQKAPAFIISKNRSISRNWPTYHQSTSNIGDSAQDVVYLDLNIVGNSDNFRSVNDTTFSTTTWNGVSGNGNDHIAYCWTEIEGYSKFGSYIGNGSTDGPFVYCGFKPAWVLIKKTNGSGDENWRLLDSSRCPTNQNNKHLLPSSSTDESTETGMDFLSNGFKLRDGDAHQNQDGTTYIFAAFAESPFQTANAR